MLRAVAGAPDAAAVMRQVFEGALGMLPNAHRAPARNSPDQELTRSGDQKTATAICDWWVPCTSPIARNVLDCAVFATRPENQCTMADLELMIISKIYTS
jgi:hypothetical protein